MLRIALPLLSLAATASPTFASPPQDPAIRVWLNKSGYVEQTDKVRAYLRAGVDGYVVVLHAEPSGRVRVLFPIDPDDDAFVRSGRDYEIRSRSDREAIAVYDASGTGVVLAAVARDPMRFDGLVLNGHWDYRLEERFAAGNDAEADLLGLVQQMTGGGWFEYDVVRYQVGSYYVADDAYHPSMYGPAVAGHYWGGGIAFTVGFGWWDPWYYYPYYGWYPYGPWSYWGYASWYHPYYWYPYAYYAPWYYSPFHYHGYQGFRYARHYYAWGSDYNYGRGGAWGTYAFKSYDDRYGLNPRGVTARRRTPTSGSYAVAPAARVTTSGRRTAAAVSSTTGGSRSPTAPTARRPTTTASDGSTVLPTISGRGRSEASSGSGTPASRSAGAPDTRGRRPVPDDRGPASAAEGARRGQDVIGRAGRDAVSSDVRGGGSSPSRGLQYVRSTPSAGRQQPGTAGSGRTTKPSSGALERRTPSQASATRSMPSPTRSAPSTTRSAPPTRSTPTVRSPPPARSSPPRSAPSRPPSSGGGSRRRG
jgi:hypothetical protein